jgi:cellobiose-specific phosphotransferase system component IIA
VEAQDGLSQFLQDGAQEVQVVTEEAQADMEEAQVDMEVVPVPAHTAQAQVVQETAGGKLLKSL